MSTEDSAGPWSSLRFLGRCILEPGELHRSGAVRWERDPTPAAPRVPHAGGQWRRLGRGGHLQSQLAHCLAASRASGSWQQLNVPSAHMWRALTLALNLLSRVAGAGFHFRKSLWKTDRRGESASQGVKTELGQGGTAAWSVGSAQRPGDGSIRQSQGQRHPARPLPSPQLWGRQVAPGGCRLAGPSASVCCLPRDGSCEQRLRTTGHQVLHTLHGAKTIGEPDPSQGVLTRVTLVRKPPSDGVSRDGARERAGGERLARASAAAVPPLRQGRGTGLSEAKGG